MLTAEPLLIETNTQFHSLCS